jgi:hypothetical protein
MNIRGLRLTRCVDRLRASSKERRESMLFETPAPEETEEGGGVPEEGGGDGGGEEGGGDGGGEEGA